MCEDSDVHYMEDIDTTPSDNEEIMSNSDDEEIDSDTYTFIRGLLPNEELSAERQEGMTKDFSKVFDKRYSTSGMLFFQGSLDDALNQSVLSLDDPRPLILYIRHNESIADNIFCSNIFCSQKIVNLLNAEFIIWPWDRTNMNHYRQFLKLIIEKVGSEVASQIDSSSYFKDQCPLLVCLARENDQYSVVRIINSQIQDEEMMYNVLCLAHDDFDHQNGQDSITTESRDEKWHVPNSHLTSISSQSDQFIAIVNSLNINKGKIIAIKTIENLIWSIQYSNEKRKIDDRNGHSQNDKELFYGCPSSMALSILQNGFDDDINRIHGDKHGRGFYFSSKRELCEKYTVSEEYKHDNKAIIKCRILIDQNGSNSNFVVVDRNEQILPEYLVIYNE